MASSLAEQLVRKGYLTANQLVDYLREIKSIHMCSYPTLMRRIHSGEIGAIKVGGQFRIARSVIEDAFKVDLGGLEGGTAPLLDVSDS
jgi:excisionase family DNA binding protein